MSSCTALIPASSLSAASCAIGRSVAARGSEEEGTHSGDVEVEQRVLVRRHRLVGVPDSLCVHGCTRVGEDLQEEERKEESAELDGECAALSEFADLGDQREGMSTRSLGRLGKVEGRELKDLAIMQVCRPLVLPPPNLPAPNTDLPVCGLYPS